MIKVQLPDGRKIPLDDRQAEKVRSQGLRFTPFTRYPLVYENEDAPDESPDTVKTGELGDVDQDHFKPAEESPEEV